MEINENRKKHKFRRTVLTILLAIVCFLAGVFSSSFFFRTPQSPARSNESTLEQIEYLMGSGWLYARDYEDLDKELENKALYGMTTFDFDPYTSYMSKEEMDSLAESINRDYVGIGLQYANEDGEARVMRVFKDSPAEKAGIEVGDIIFAVDGKIIDDLENTELRELVLGEKGSEVIIGIRRGNETFDLSVIRDEISATAFVYVEDGCLIVELDSFGETTADEIVRYLDAYPQIDRVIFDVRNNGGGYQSAIRDVLGLFIGPNEVYLIQRDVDGNEFADHTPADTKYYDQIEKVVILTNPETASAAEVFSITMKEKAKNVTLVGETTFGKGVIQGNKSLNNGGVLKMTNYYWYSPSGVSINKTGVVPDVEVRMPDIYYEVYYPMEDDEKYEYDSVGEKVRFAQMSLQFLGYDVDRCDGYFDRSFSDALIAFKGESGLSAMAVLDKPTYDTIISRTQQKISKDPSCDLQMLKAKEIINENQH